jgi:uncharacterized membrane protein (DUF2068 family)
MRNRRKFADIGRGRRPTGIVVITIVELFVALYLFIGLTAVSSVKLSGLLGGFAASLIGFGSGVLLLWAVLLLISAYGLWCGAKWGYWLAMIMSIILILSVVVLDVVGFVVAIAVIFYLTRKRARQWFMMKG